MDSLLLSYTVITNLPHDIDAFTEGLEIYNNRIIESTGQNGSSWIAEVDPTNGVIQKKIILPEQFFGEGITVLNRKIYHLTYKTRIGFVYDANTYKKIGEFEFDAKIKEGWGLTHDGSNLIASDGTDRIHFVDTTDFKVVKSISVRDNVTKISNINELEFMGGYIYANVSETNLILKIDPENGRVVGRLDLSGVREKVHVMHSGINELNGIAYDKNSKAFLVTGKNWPLYYLIRIE